jgi:hypothetical protein
MQVVVLGMHRSGTSPVARLVNLMGLYFGPEGSGLPANEENPRGFWERTDVVSLNDRLLDSVGANWCDIHPFLVRNVERDGINPVVPAIAATILELDAHRPWFLKDPRFSLTLPFWRPFLDSPSVFVCWRNPAAVVASLLRRSERDTQPLARDEAYALWEAYMVAALKGSSIHERLIVDFDKLISDPPGFCQRLHSWLESRGHVALRIPTARELGAFVDAKLVHSAVDDSWRDYPSVAAIVDSLRAGGEMIGLGCSDWSLGILRSMSLRLRKSAVHAPARVGTRLTDNRGRRIEMLLQSRVDLQPTRFSSHWSSATLASLLHADSQAT